MKIINIVGPIEAYQNEFIDHIIDEKKDNIETFGVYEFNKNDPERIPLLVDRISGGSFFNVRYTDVQLMKESIKGFNKRVKFLKDLDCKILICRNLIPVSEPVVINYQYYGCDGIRLNVVPDKTIVLLASPKEMWYYRLRLIGKYGEMVVVHPLEKFEHWYKKYKKAALEAGIQIIEIKDGILDNAYKEIKWDI